MEVSINGLEPQQVLAGINRLNGVGITPERWISMCEADEEKMRRIAAGWPGGFPSVCDAETVCETLGLPLPCNCTEEAPKTTDGEVVVWYGGWKLEELVATGKVVNHLPEEMVVCAASPGYYQVVCPVPDSNGQTFFKQVEILVRFYAALRALPTPVGVTALAVYLGVTGEDLLKGELCRCAEALLYGNHPVIGINGDHVCVDRTWDDSCSGYIHLGAARKLQTLSACP